MHVHLISNVKHEWKDCLGLFGFIQTLIDWAIKLRLLTVTWVRWTPRFKCIDMYYHQCLILVFMTSLCIMYWWWNVGSYVRLCEGQNILKAVFIWRWLKYVCSVHLSLSVWWHQGWTRMMSFHMYTASALASFVSTCTMKDKCVCGYDETIIHNKEEGIWFTLSSNSCLVLIPYRRLIWGHCSWWTDRMVNTSSVV